MKSLSYILLTCLLIVTYGCKENEHPYVGYLRVESTVIEAETGASSTLLVDTDLSDPITLEVNEAGAAWCSATANGKEITVTAIQTNPDAGKSRTATVTVRCGYRVATILVLQKYVGQDDWSTWSATGSSVQANDGGGYPSLFTETRTTFWHSQYSPALNPPLPHWIVIDMKKNLQVAKVHIGRRLYAANGNNYPSVKTMEVYASTDNLNFTKVGGFTFALPWTAPDATVINGNSPKIPGYEEVILSEKTTARYIKLVITETNNTNGTCQVSYFKAFEEL